jgi:hypothetical protein
MQRGWAGFHEKFEAIWPEINLQPACQPRRCVMGFDLVRRALQIAGFDSQKS